MRVQNKRAPGGGNTAMAKIHIIDARPVICRFKKPQIWKGFGIDVVVNEFDVFLSESDAGMDVVRDNKIVIGIPFDAPGDVGRWRQKWKSIAGGEKES